MTRSTSHSTWIFEAVDQDGQAIVSTFKSNGTRPESIHELALEWGREVGADRVIGYAKKSAHRGPGFVLRVADDRIEYHPPLLGIDAVSYTHLDVYKRQLPQPVERQPVGGLIFEAVFAIRIALQGR